VILDFVIAQLLQVTQKRMIGLGDLDNYRLQGLWSKHTIERDIIYNNENLKDQHYSFHLVSVLPASEASLPGISRTFKVLIIVDNISFNRMFGSQALQSVIVENHPDQSFSSALLATIAQSQKSKIT